MRIDKTKMVITALTILLAAACVSGCQAAILSSLIAKTPIPAASPSAAIQSQSVGSPSASAPTPAPTAQTFQLVEKTYGSGAISIRYPQIVGMADKAAQDQLNELIAKSALRDVESLKSDPPEEYTITDTVTFNNPDVISVYFDGYMNMKDSAHPSQFFYSVTVDGKNRRVVTFPQLISVNSDIVHLLGKGEYRSAAYDMTDDAKATIRDYISSMGTDYWLNELRNADSQGHDTSSFVTKDALGLSVSVPHALGDHIEILLNYNDLRGYQTDNPIWKAIEAPSAPAIPNPVHESTAEEILDTLGITFHIPAEAADVRYSVIDVGQGAPIAQAQFKLNGTDYTYRIQSTEAFSDISGAMYDWTNKQKVDVSYCSGEVRYIPGKQGVSLWYDTVPGLMYSLYAGSGASKDSLLDLANKLFVPAKDY